MGKELYVIDTEGNILNSTTHEEFNSNYELQLDIYNQHHSKKGHTIYCGCSKKPIKMYIAKNKDRNGKKGTIYLVNYDGQGAKHSESCNYNKEYNYLNDRERGWEEDKKGNGTYLVNLSKSLLEINTESPNDNVRPDEYKNLYYGEGTSGSPHRVSIYGLASRFILISYRKYLQSRASHPENINEFLKYLYGQSNAITMKTKSKRAHRKTLNDIWYKGKDGAHIGTSRFVLREFDFSNIQEDKVDDDFLIIKAPRPQDNSIIDEIARVRKDVFDKLALQIKHHAEPNIRAGGKLLLSGFIQKKEDSYGYIYWEFASITILNVTKTGLLVDSGYETLAYHKAIDEDILFYKPEGPLAYYNDWIPDMLFLRPLNPGKVYLGEIFGFNSDEYYDHTEDKITFITDSDNLDMWEWHANKNEKMPVFY